MRERFRFLILVLCGLPIAVGAADNAAPRATHPLPSATDFSATILPETEGVVPWRTLSQVKYVKENEKLVLSFSSEILRLDQKEQRVQGFMIPLGLGTEQTHFLVSPVPPTCPFCVPAAAAEIVEVRTKAPVAYEGDPLMVAGKFAVLRNDPSGVIYRMLDATASPVNQAPKKTVPLGSSGDSPAR